MPSKTFFFTVTSEDNPLINQVSITYSTNKHWYYRLYVGGIVQNKLTRCNLVRAAELAQKDLETFKAMYGLEDKPPVQVVRRVTMRTRQQQD